MFATLPLLLLLSGAASVRAAALPTLAALPPAPLVASALRAAALGDSPSPPPLDCPTCEFVMGVYEEIAGNATTLRQFVALFEEACSVIAPGVPALTALCDAVISGLLEGVLPFLDKELSTLAWDIPETFCAVFIPVCTIPCCDAPTAPEQRRLAWTADPAALSVQWTTLQLVGGAGAQFFPSATGGPPTFAPAAPRTYTLGGWLGTLYSATMGGLSAGTAYTYRVGSDGGGWSAWANFSTLPADAGSDARPLRLVHIGDMGWGGNSNATIAAVEALAAQGVRKGVWVGGEGSGGARRSSARAEGTRRPLFSPRAHLTQPILTRVPPPPSPPTGHRRRAAQRRRVLCRRPAEELGRVRAED